MAQVVGERTTYQAVSETRLIRRVDDEIGYLEPDIAPLVTLTMKMRKRMAVDSPRVEYYEDDYVARWGQNGTATVANTTASTTVTVTDGTLFIAGDLFVVPKVLTSSSAPEICRVTAVTGNVLTVVRDIGGVGADTILPSAAVSLLGNANQEGGAIPSAKSTAPALRTNFLQIVRTVVDLSKTNIASKQYGAPGGERKRLHDKKLKEHKIALNRIALFGQKSESLGDGASSKPIRTSDGLNSIISSNVTDASGTLTFQTWEAFSRQAFRYGKQRKMLLCAPIIKSALNEWGKSYLLVKPGETKLGVKIQEVETAHGTWLVANDWMLENAVSGQNGFGNMAFSIDLDQLSYRYLAANGQNRDTHLTENVIMDGGDRLVDEILTEAAFVFKQEKYHAKIFNVTGYSA